MGDPRITGRQLGRLLEKHDRLVMLVERTVEQPQPMAKNDWSRILSEHRLQDGDSVFLTRAIQGLARQIHRLEFGEPAPARHGEELRNPRLAIRGSR